MNTDTKTIATAAAFVITMAVVLFGLVALGIMLVLKTAETGDIAYAIGGSVAHLMALAMAGVLGSCFRR